MASRAAAHLINVGHGNVVVAEQVVAIVALDSLPVKRLIESAKGSMKLVDATNGRRTRAVIVTGSDHLILSSLEPATLAQRLRERRSDPEREIARRLARAREEIRLWRSYDYLVVNRDQKDAADQLTAIITAERCRTTRLALDFPDLEVSK